MPFTAAIRLKSAPPVIQSVVPRDEHVAPCVGPRARRVVLDVATIGYLVPAAGFMVRLFVIQHDCGHGSLFRSRWANDLTGRIIGVFTLTPYDYWRRTHAAHHAGSGNLDRRGIGDITTLTVREYLGLSRLRRFAYRLYRHPLVLFGVGFGIFLRSARRRSERPRLLLVRRFAALALLGGVLHLLQPGEVLLPFAITGLLVLLPLSYLPVRFLLGAAAVLIVAGVLAGVGGLGLLPGLFALGFALAELRAPEALHESRGRLVGVGVSGLAAYRQLALDPV